jgi:hypothetical protein
MVASPLAEPSPSPERRKTTGEVEELSVQSSSGMVRTQMDHLKLSSPLLGSDLPLIF